MCHTEVTVALQIVITKSVIKTWPRSEVKEVVSKNKNYNCLICNEDALTIDEGYFMYLENKSYFFFCVITTGDHLAYLAYQSL